MRMVLAVTLAIAPLLAKGNEPVKRLNESAAVFSEIMATPDKGIPQDLLAKVTWIVIVPPLKTGVSVIGSKYGGSVGFQIGGSGLALERAAAKLISLLNKYSARERTSKSTGSSQ